MIYDSLVDFYTTGGFQGFFTSRDLFIYFLSESTNLIFCCLVVALFFFANKLSLNELLFWVFLFILAFLINIFVNYNPNYFPDIGGYLRCIRDLRDNFQMDEVGCGTIVNSNSEGGLSFLSMKRGLPAIIFAFIPMPSIATYSAIGMINKMLTFFLYLFLKPLLKNKDNVILLCLIFLLPTFLLYSSIGLRDNLIFVVMVFLLFFLLQNKFLLSTISLLILLGIKSQNGIIFMIPYIGVFIFGANKSMKGFFALVFFTLIGLLLIQDAVVSTINFFVLSFVYENQGRELMKYVDPYNSIVSILLYAPLEFLIGLVRPMPNGAIALLFFLDSLVQLFLIAYLVLTNRTRLFKSPEFLLVLMTFFMGLVLNSMVVDNDNTFVRYKYTFYYCFLIYLITVNKTKIPWFNKLLNRDEQ
ncbi:hypothetical protein N9P46_03610 [Gammaproteobacteria bacterium]|nr:hypothetical protein [Gammaproteobacteria bacterium]